MFGCVLYFFGLAPIQLSQNKQSTKTKNKKRYLEQDKKFLPAVKFRSSVVANRKFFVELLTRTSHVGVVPEPRGETREGSTSSVTALTLVPDRLSLLEVCADQCATTNLSRVATVHS